MSMEDLKALTECAECTWDYIDRLRMALAAACKERDELKKRLSAYEDTGLEPEEIERIVDAYGRGHTLRTESAERLEIVREIKTDRLRELAKAEKDGRLEVLPCKVGDHILADGREAIVVWFFGYKTGRYLHAQFLDNAECADIPFYEIGKNRLSAREDAEAAMAKKGDSEQ